jgi:predicted lactoylglutathione lyase
MSTQIFITLPVANLSRPRAFYGFMYHHVFVDPMAIAEDSIV